MKKGTCYMVLLLFLLAFTLPTKSQNFIGIHKNEIAGLLNKINPQFKLDKSTVNHSYNYLKYVDKITDQTILFFLSDEDECTYVRWMCDYSNLSDMTAMLNQRYHKEGPNSWSYSDKGVDYAVTLAEDEWYFTVSFRKN